MAKDKARMALLQKYIDDRTMIVELLYNNLKFATELRLRCDELAKMVAAIKDFGEIPWDVKHELEELNK